MYVHAMLAPVELITGISEMSRSEIIVLKSPIQKLMRIFVLIFTGQ